HGAQDYLEKDNLTNDLLGRSVQFAIQRTNALAALTRLATHDSLTDLPNRTLLLDRLQIALARAKRLGTHVAALFIDIDDIKAIIGVAMASESLLDAAALLRTADAAMYKAKRATKTSARS